MQFQKISIHPHRRYKTQKMKEMYAMYVNVFHKLLISISRGVGEVWVLSGTLHIYN